MQRWFGLVCGALAVWAIDAGCAAAAAPGVNANWPPFPGEFSRGPGYYLATWKILTCWFLLASWVRTTDWVSQDCLKHQFNYALWNSVTFFSFVAAMILVWIVPWFALGLILLLAAYIAPLTVYVRYHNSKVEIAERVFNKAHFRRVLARTANKLGGKMDVEKKLAHELGPPLQLIAMGAAEQQNNINLFNARQSPGYLPARVLLDDALKHRADGIVLDYTEQQVGVRYQIDGVWHNYTPQDRVNGDMMLAVYKTVAGLDINERRARQSGAFGFEIDKKKSTCKITSQGTKTGEMVVLTMVASKPAFKKMDDIGIRAKVQEQILGLLNEKTGFFFFSSLPGGGLTTMTDVVLDSTDRYMRNFVSVEDEHKRERDLENIPTTTYDSQAGETPDTIMPKLIRTYPDLFVIRDLVNLETLEILCHQVAHEGRAAVSTVRAKDAPEALLRILLMKIPPSEFAAVVSGVLNMRLIRKLCEKCKEAYAPPPEILKQLGLPEGRIEAFYRPPTQPIDPKNPDKVCEDCLGIGYKGRTAIFELLVVDDTIRNVLATQPKLDLLRAAVRKGKQRSLQDEGVLLVVKGVTSLPELMRVLKQGT